MLTRNRHWNRSRRTKFHAIHQFLPNCQAKEEQHVSREICVSIKERFIHVCGIENPRDDECLYHVRRNCKRRRKTWRGDSFLFVAREAETALGVWFQYFGHIAEVRESRRAETGSPGWDAWDGRRSRVFFSLAKGYVRREGVLLLLQRNSNKSSLGSLELVEAPRRSPDEAFFPIPSTLFESAIASRASLLSTFRVLLSYTEKKELLSGTKYVQLKIKSMK